MFRAITHNIRVKSCSSLTPLRGTLFNTKIPYISVSQPIRGYSSGFVLRSNSPDELWNFIPPRSKTSDRSDDHIIEVKPGERLTVEEITSALERQGAVDIEVIKLATPLDKMTKMIIATGSSSRHIYKMGTSIARCLKARGLTEAVGSRGVEGDKDDNWIAVDCYTIGVHILLSDTRKHLKLEEHLKSPNKPLLPPQSKYDDDEYDRIFDELLEKYPIPEGYNADVEETTKVNTPSGVRKVPKNVTKL